MMKSSNIFLLFNLFIFGLISSSNVLLAQNKEAVDEAEDISSKAIDCFRKNNLDSAFVFSKDLLKIARAEKLTFYEAQAEMLIGRYFMVKGDSDSSMCYLNKSAVIFTSINDTVNLGKILFFKGLVFKSIGETDSMFKYQLRANDLFLFANDTNWYGISNNYLGLNYSNLGNYVLALKHLQNSLEAFKLSGAQTNVAAIYNAMGTVYRKTKDKEKEEEAYLNTIEILTNTKESIILGQAFNNLSEIYFDKGETKKAFETLEKAKKVFEDVGYPLGLCSYYSVSGYYYSTQNPPDNLKVIENFNKSISIAKEYGDLRQYADGTAYLGTAYMEIGEFQKARTILKKGMVAAEENGFNPEIMKISKILAEVYSRSGQTEKAYQLLQQHLALKDSLSGEDKIKEFTQLDLQYKFRQQQIGDSLRNVQRELEKDFLHAKELQSEERSKLIFLFISVLVIVIAVFIFVSSQKRKKTLKALKDKKAQIEKQNTEIETYAKEVSNANKKLLELDEYKQSMTNMLVHDLKNPLNLLANIDMVEDEKTRSTLIKNTSKQMLNLVLNLLDVSKAEASELELDKTEVGLSDIINESSREVDYLSSPVNIEIVNKSIKDYSFQADRDILVRVFVNLFSNAIKFSPRGSSIIISTSITPDKQVRISVKDSGPGIAKEFHKTIFEKFKQVEQLKSGEIKSTGLGLAFCKLAIESHGWEIGVDSEPGKGAEFWILVDGFKEIAISGAAKKSGIQLIGSQLTDRERQLIKPYLSMLSKLDTSSFSKIEKTLSALKKENIKGIDKWIKEILIATENLDDDKFKKLLEELAGQTKFP
ncbi:MAG: sensor histidine kinase [Chlorobi bacterium]|nr:sensor histidine kinase [Chlorobiota bacterium]